MGAGLDTITGQTTAPGSTITALTAATGDSFQVRNSNLAKRTLLIGAWARNQGAGVLEIKSPKLHDNTRAMRFRVTTTDVFPLFPLGQMQALYPQDTLTVSLSGSSSSGKIEQASLLVYYEDLAGADGQFIDAPTVSKRLKHIFAVETAITPGTSGNYSGGAAINASFDTFIANSPYALLGYHVDAECCSVCFHGVDTANMRVSGPGLTTLRHLTGNWFARLSNATGIPLIPVFNSSNKAGITVDVAQNDGGAAVNVTSIFALLQ